MTDQYFKMEQTQHQLLFTFSNKDVKAFMNLLSNFFASLLQPVDSLSSNTNTIFNV